VSISLRFFHAFSIEERQDNDNSQQRVDEEKKKKKKEDEAEGKKCLIYQLHRRITSIANDTNRLGVHSIALSILRDP
jgi:hypothetical protein